MIPLSPEDIQRLPQLLLHEDVTNVSLGVEILRAHPDAVPPLYLPLEVGMLIGAGSRLLEPFFMEHFPDYQLRESPLYVLRQAVGGRQLVDRLYKQTQRWIEVEPLYRPYLTQVQDGHSYLLLAHYLAPVERFRGAAYVYYQLAFPKLTDSADKYANYANFLRDYPPVDWSREQWLSTVQEYYQQAYSKEKNYGTIKRLADFLEHQTQDVDAARSIWNRFINDLQTTTLTTDYYKSYFEWLKLEVRAQQWEMAQKLADQIWDGQETGWIGMNADNFYYHVGLIAWHGQQNLTQAAQYMEEALEENAYFTDPLQALLEITVTLQDYQAALRWHKMALELAPYDVFLLMEAGRIAELAEEPDQARLYYRDILAINADYPPAQEAIRRLS